MSERRGDDLPLVRRVRELEDYCHPIRSQLTLEGLQEKIAGIPPDAVRDSDFFHYACQNDGVTLEMIQCLLEAFPEVVQSIDERERCLPLHWACMNRRATLEMVECLLRAFPEAARSSGEYGQSPLHCACSNKNIDPGIVRLLLDRWPESVNHRNDSGRLPLHDLCESGRVDETASCAILDLLLTAAPNSATVEDGNDDLPIHTALNYGYKCHSFCKRLIDADPETLRVQSHTSGLPIHLACYYGDVKTVKYMLELAPETIDARDTDGDLPIHWAARSHYKKTCKTEIIRYLLTKDPDYASRTGRNNRLPLHLACGPDCLDSMRLLFDAYPEAINIRDGEDKTPLDVARRPVAREREEASRLAIVEFLEAQLIYARQAEDTRALRTPDENGWLPLHRALRDGASLGTIKLLIAGNRDALQVACNGLAFPLHIACTFNTVDVVKYLLGCLDIHLHTLDFQKDSTLHYACRGGNTGVVKYLLERRVPSVSEPNGDGKLPIHLLWESDRSDRDSVEYVEANWLLLLAHTETVTH